MVSTNPTSIMRKYVSKMHLNVFHLFIRALRGHARHISGILTLLDIFCPPLNVSLSTFRRHRTLLYRIRCTALLNDVLLSVSPISNTTPLIFLVFLLLLVLRLFGSGTDPALVSLLSLQFIQ